MRIYAKLFDFNFPGRTYFWGKAFMFASTLEFFFRLSNGLLMGGA